MTNELNKGNVSNDITTSTEKTSFTIEVYQEGEFLKKQKDNSFQVVKLERKYTSLILNFEINNDLPTFGKFAGRVIDMLIADKNLNFYINNKVFSSKLNLCFAIHFDNKEFNGSKFFEIKPNFFNTQANLHKFYKGLTLFLASVKGLYKPFSYENNIDANEIINNPKNVVLKKDFERINANKYIDAQIKELLFSEIENVEKPKQTRNSRKPRTKKIAK